MPNESKSSPSVYIVFLGSFETYILHKLLVTVTLHVAVLLFEVVAVIVALPISLAIMTPLLVTVTTLLFEELHVIVLSSVVLEG